MSTKKPFYQHRIDAQKFDSIQEWIEKQQMENEGLDEESSIAESSVVSTSVDGDSETDFDNILDDDRTASKILASSSELSVLTQSIKELFNSITSIQTVGNVNITNSTGVHIGNVTNINGNIQIIQQHINGTDTEVRQQKKKPNKTQENEERVSPEAFLNNIKIKIPKTLCAIVPRYSWLAQLPMEEYDFLEEPVQYVVISHTATESSEKAAINKRIIRDTQCFHIESRGWNDIAYNFLIGCDGNCYEGRGWSVVGAHTLGYNTRAIGISFVGCFMRVLPTEAALNACRNLLKKGVENGHLATDYKLICHCQCCATESPGRRLFEELQKWEHFHDLEDEEN